MNIQGDSVKILILIALSCMKVLGGMSWQDCRLRYTEGPKGFCIKPWDCPGASLGTLCADTAYKCCVLEKSTGFPQPSSTFTWNNYATVFGNKPRQQTLYNAFVRAIADANAVSCFQRASFISQIAVDTDFLRDMEERIPLKKRPFTNWKYIGRGALQIPGYQFYAWLSARKKTNYTFHPDLLAFPSHAFSQASEVWQSGYTPVQNTTVSYNNMSDGTDLRFALQTYFLKASLKDLEYRQAVMSNVTKVLGCGCIERNTIYKCAHNGRQGVCTFKRECKGAWNQYSSACPGPPDLVGCCVDCVAAPKLTIVIVVDHDKEKHGQKELMLKKLISETSNYKSDVSVAVVATPKFFDSTNTLSRLQRIAQDVKWLGVFHNFNQSISQTTHKLFLSANPFADIAILHGTKCKIQIEDTPSLELALAESLQRGKLIKVKLDNSSHTHIVIDDGYSITRQVELDAFAIRQILQHVCLVPTHIKSGKVEDVKITNVVPRYIGIPYEHNRKVRLRTTEGHLKVRLIRHAHEIPGNENRKCRDSNILRVVGKSASLVILENSLNIDKDVVVFNGFIYVKAVSVTRAAILEIYVSDVMSTSSKINIYLLASHVVLLTCSVFSLIASVALYSRLSRKSSGRLPSSALLKTGTDHVDVKFLSKEMSPYICNRHIAKSTRKQSGTCCPCAPSMDDDEKVGNNRSNLRSEAKYYCGLKTTKVFSVVLYSTVVVSSACENKHLDLCWLLCGLFSFSSVAFFSISLTEIWALFTMVQMAKPTRTHKLLLIILAFALPTVVSVSSCWAKRQPSFLCWSVINSSLKWIMVVCNACLFLINLGLVFLLNSKLAKRELKEDRRSCQKTFIFWDFTITVVFSICWTMTLFVIAFPDLAALQYATAFTIACLGIVFILGNCMIALEFRGWRSCFVQVRFHIGRNYCDKSSLDGTICADTQRRVNGCTAELKIITDHASPAFDSHLSRKAHLFLPDDYSKGFNGATGFG